MIIKTERLLLRPITLDDDKDIFEYSKDPLVGANAGWKPHETIEETKEIIKTLFLGNATVFGIANKTNGKIIGTVGLIKDPKRENDKVMMLGYALARASWGNGYMTEAAKAIVRYGFENLELDMISVYCYPHNNRSLNVIKKLGFYYEGTLSLCEKLYDGRVLDHQCFRLMNSTTRRKCNPAATQKI